MDIKCLYSVPTYILFSLCLLTFSGKTGSEANGILEDRSHISPLSRKDDSEKLKKPKNEKEIRAKGEILVKFKKNVTRDEVEAINKELNATIIKKSKNRNLYRLKISDGETIDNMISKYQRLAEVEYAQPNFIYQINSPDRLKDL